MSSSPSSPQALLAAARQAMFNGEAGPDSPLTRLGLQAVAAARQAGDAQVEALALFHAHHHRLLALPFEQADAEILALHQQCLAMGQPPGAWLQQITRANLYLLHRRYVEAHDIAVKLDRRRGGQLAPIEHAALLFVLTAICRASGRFDEVIDHAARCVRAADAAQQPYARAAARVNFAGVLLEQPMDAEAALRHLDDAQALLEALPRTAAWAQLLSTRIQALDFLGRHEEAYQLFQAEFSDPDAVHRGRDTRAGTVLALLGVGRLDEAQQWLGEPPDLPESAHAWRRHQAYRRANARLLCARREYAQARAYIEADLDTPRNYTVEPLYELRMQDMLREACSALGDHPAALEAAIAARQAGLPVVRLSSRARYLVSQLEDGAKRLADLTPVDLRRLAEIDKAVQDEQRLSMHALQAAAEGAMPASGHAAQDGPNGPDGPGPPAPPAASAPHAERPAELAAQPHDAPPGAAPAAPQVPRFLAHVVHELRNPIGGVLGMAALLKGSELDERQRRYANLLESSAQTLLSLVNDVLDLAKMERGQFSLNPGTVAVRPWLADTLAPYVVAAQLRQLALRGTVDVRVPEQLCFDALRLRQVLANLVTNGLKFTCEGEVLVHLGWLPDSTATHGHLRCEVRDTGSGIPADELGGLFQEFVQVSTRAADGQGGTGLGLALCKQLVDRMGGRIGVDSRPGEGSTFWFELALPVPDHSLVR